MATWPKHLHKRCRLSRAWEQPVVYQLSSTLTIRPLVSSHQIRQASIVKFYYKIIKQSSVTKNTHLGLL